MKLHENVVTEMIVLVLFVTIFTQSVILTIDTSIAHFLNRFLSTVFTSIRVSNSFVRFYIFELEVRKDRSCLLRFGKFRLLTRVVRERFLDYN